MVHNGQIEIEKGQSSFSSLAARLKCLRFACVPSGPYGAWLHLVCHTNWLCMCVCVREKQQRDSSVLLIVVYQWPRMLLKFDNSPN